MAWIACHARASRTGSRREARRQPDARAEVAGEFAEARDGRGPKRVPDPGAAALAFDPAGVAEDLEVVRDGRLADVAAGGEVAGADLGDVAQLAQDREPGRVGGGLEEEDVGVGLALHAANVLTSVYIVKYQYSDHDPITTRGATHHDHRDHPRDRARALRRRRGPRLPGLVVLQRSGDDRRRTSTPRSSATSFPTPPSWPRSAAAIPPPSPTSTRASASSISDPGAGSTSCCRPSGSGRPGAPSGST